MRINLDTSVLKSLIIMGFVIEARDPYTGGHLWRVSRYAEEICRELGLEKSIVFQARMGGFLHDLGKVGVPDAILRKEGRLDDAEYETMKTHPIVGGTIMTEHPLRDLVYDAILGHHERMDGHGYPYGRHGDQIPVGTLAVSVADALDAMTSNRPYRKGMPIPKAVERLLEAADTQFERKTVDAIVALHKRGTLDPIQGHSDEGRPMVTCPRCGPVVALPRSKGDGDTVFCPVCTAEGKIHDHGEGWEMEHTHRHGTPRDMRYEPDLDLIQDIVLQAPKIITVELSQS
jgi:HD-GYP domain-containing protein (c-di-GMP phosphodiesterase class II)